MFSQHNDVVFQRNGSQFKTVKPQRGYGRTPAVILCNPKYHHNVGGAVRAAGCYGIGQVWFTGTRVDTRPPRDKRYRLPREERMKDYEDVSLINYQRPFDLFDGCTPVAVEVRDNSESLFDFEHPDDAVYVFGPEDGSVPKSILVLCHRFVVIPTKYCLNMTAAMNTVLYDRALKTRKNI